MKALAKHTFIFDAECPLCRAYSSAFIKTGMLDKNGREAYQQMTEQTCTLIDKDRARNEIALINTVSGEVYYGIDSIFKVLGNSYPVFKPLFAFSPFRWIMKKVYSFISYNRKVIMPGKQTADTCVPDLNIKYRWMYLLFTWLVTSFILTRYSNYLTGVIPASKFFREFFICGGQIVFQAIVIQILAKGKVLQYLGNMMTISFAASLLLVLFVLVGKIFSIVNPLIYTGFFMLIVLFMFLEHIRRMKLIGISWMASASWVVYRVIVLILILKLL
jgi:predicted DCC family thiol-disulfide oxidoreductase YuxK